MAGGLLGYLKERDATRQAKQSNLGLLSDPTLLQQMNPTQIQYLLGANESDPGAVSQTLGGLLFQKPMTPEQQSQQGYMEAMGRIAPAIPNVLAMQDPQERELAYNSMMAQAAPFDPNVLKGISGMVSPDTGGEAYGKNVIWGQDAQGNPVALQASGAGGPLRAAAAPEGVRLTMPMSYLNTGESFIPAPTRGIPGQLPTVQRGLSPEQQPSYLGQAEAVKTLAQGQAKAQADLPSVISAGEQTLSLIEDLKKHPGLKSAVGWQGIVPLPPGTPAKDFEVRLNQLKGQQFLQAYNALKGSGQITEVEGKKAENAIARIDRSQTEKEFMQALDDFQNVIKIGIENSKKKAGVANSSVRPPLSSFQGK